MECCLQEEAFQLWTQEWGCLYPEGSKSRSILEDIAKTWYLVSVVENDYINGDLFSVFDTHTANGTANGNGLHTRK